MNELVLGPPRLIVDARAMLGECPLWDVQRRCLYWIDIGGRALHCLAPDTGISQRWPTASDPGCIALTANGDLIVAMRDGVYRFDVLQACFTLIAPAPYDSSTTRFNDGRCDAAGRFWAGTIFEPRTAPLAAMYCLERGRLRLGWGPESGHGVKVSNGLAFSGDHRYLYQSDTPEHVIYRFDFDLANGQVGERRVFARCADDRAAPGYGGRPDGAAVDEQDCYWSAQYQGGRVVRYSPRGDVIATIVLPVSRPTMVAFGGDDLRTLYVTSAREGADAAELHREPLAGGLFAVPLSVAGRAEPRYLD